MYNSRLFQESDRERLFDFIDAYSFGMLLVPDGGGVEIAHLPFLLERSGAAQGALRCHVAKPNRIWQLAQDGRPVTAVFTGPHTYISPRWYEHPTRQVPTWNYTVVHAHGRARAVFSEPELRAMLRDLAAANERGAESPWTLEAADAEYIRNLLGGIVGLEISIDRLEGKLKLNQNRTEEDRRRVRRELRARAGETDLEMLRWMPEDQG
jgi:transcriptional regulator